MTLTLSAILLFSGCYWNTPIIDLISPPKLTREQTQVYNALINLKGSGLTLKYPKTGEFLSAFVFFPNAPDKAMVFYEQSGASSEPTLWLTFLERRSNIWVCANDISFFATDIERVDFSNLGDSARENIIISYSIAADKHLRVIALTESGKHEEVYSGDYCLYHEIGDFDKSGVKTLMSINQSDVGEARVSFAGWNEGRFGVIYYTEMNPNATDYVRSTVGDSLLFLDYSQPDNFNTAIIAFRDSRRPRNMVFTRDVTLRDERLRLLVKQPNRFTAHAYSRDIDGDGTINVAGNRRFPGYNQEFFANSDYARAAIWYKVIPSSPEMLDGELERLYYTYLGVNNDYVFFFPEAWEEQVTVTHNLESGEVTFWEYDRFVHESVHDVDTPLLGIIAIAKDEPRSTGDYTMFSTDYEHFNYYVRIYNESITLDELHERLRIF